MNSFYRIGIAGGGPAALFICKHLLEQKKFDFSLDIFEAGSRLGYGMPYGPCGANAEHVTNVSGNEIPELFTPLLEWMRQLPEEKLSYYGLSHEKLHEYRVVPRLLFGEYLSGQFEICLEKLKKRGVEVHIHYESRVTDVSATGDITTEQNKNFAFDKVIICTGHYWPKTHEDKTEGWFDSPYPPSKLRLKANHKIAIRGSSLTAIDAVKTLARANGKFVHNDEGRLCFNVFDVSPEFNIVMHSVHGLLPCIRFHLEEPLISGSDLMPDEKIEKHIKSNDGFLPIDAVFDYNFKKAFKDTHPEFYQSIKDMSIEEFVDAMLSRRENIEAFTLFREEYAEAEKSIEERRSIYWKEMLASLSFAMNYPAKHFSGEDMERLQKVLAPLIAVVIAFIPQGSADELLALHAAGRLQLISVEKESRVEPNSDGGSIYIYDEDNRDTFPIYVDCVGQKHFKFEEFPFKSLVDNRAVSPARLKYKAKDGYMDLPGVAITDDFRVIDADGQPSDDIFIMAVPYISGHNPDYSGLDFCEEASSRIVSVL